MSSYPAQIKVPVHHLAEGMYVARLDRPWVETPFPFQGFVIRNGAEIRRLQEYCTYVHIDVEKGKAPEGEFTTGGRVPPNVPPAPLPKPAVRYEDEHPVEEEMDTAKQVRGELTSAVSDFMDNVRRGKKPEVHDVKQSVTRMEESILRNPDAFMWLRRLKKKDSYTYSHCIDMSMLAIAFGRQLGLPRGQVSGLGLGALLADVGKMNVPSEILSAPRPLTDQELAEVRKHVDYGLDIVNGMPGVPPHAVTAVATHHERFDGSGYPKRLGGGDIPLFERIVALVDCFDAITSDRPYAEGMSPHKAIRELYDLRGTCFQDELVEQFIQTLGIYPVGTMVELSTGQVGIVIGQNRVRRLRPRVVIVLDEEKRHLKTTSVVDLLHQTTTEDGREITIKRSLEPGAYGVEPEEFYL